MLQTNIPGYGTYMAIIYRPQFWAVGIPQGGSKGFGFISMIYIINKHYGLKEYTH